MPSQIKNTKNELTEKNAALNKIRNHDIRKNNTPGVRALLSLLAIRGTKREESLGNMGV